MYRGIKGTYVYACNKELREYLKNHIEIYKKEIPLKKEIPFRILSFEEVKPYVNSIPLIDITAAAGSFSEIQSHSELTWIEPPFNVSVRKDCFVCKVIGESMNKRIPNGSYCLFRKDDGGSRNGKIVLVESTIIQDSEFGSGYTVKEYHSSKKQSENSWEHDTIILKPLSTIENYSEIVLNSDELTDFRVVGIFEKVLN
jgi:SOS-response transcriptional repressor LexA